MGGMVGSRLEKSDGSGLSGTVVSVRSNSTWSSGSALYDIVWSDGSCSVKISAQAMTEAGWSHTGDRVSVTECNRIWTDYQVERARRMALEHAKVIGGQPVRPIVVDRQERLRQFASPVPSATRTSAPIALVIEEVEKPASWHARRLLSSAWPDIHFAVSVERKRLTVGWIDGPTENAVERVMAPLLEEGRITKACVRRGVNDLFVQAAINYVLERVWPMADARADSDRMRLSPADYLAGSMSSIVTPSHSAIGVMPYAQLIRCVIDGWDHGAERFVSVERTRHMFQEMKFLFPQGLDSAAALFRGCLQEAQEVTENARDFVEQLPRLERARN